MLVHQNMTSTNRLRSQRVAVDYHEASGEESEVELSHEIHEDRDSLKKGKQPLGLARNYVPDWIARDAFREFYQNWMDGMIESRKIRQDKVKIDIEDTAEQWVAKAVCILSGEVLGFIRFLKAKGLLELTNFKAQLTRKSLDMGCSSKRGKGDAAGTHGEGFKVAALVMVRKEYQVRYESAKYFWSFQFGGRDKNSLNCHLTPMSDTKVTKLMLAEAKRISDGKTRELRGNIWEDVTVKIGRVYNSKGKKIEASIFEDWIKVAFALVRPNNTISTVHGDLILGKAFGNRVYLKGLYLGGSATTRELKFGYNFANGKVNRDRERMMSATDEAKALASIWAEAIRLDEKTALPEYVKMLRQDIEKQWADVNLAKDMLSFATTKMIWAAMKQNCGRNGFFYHAQSLDGDEASIRKHLKKYPIPLPDCLWIPLRQSQLVRTSQEQRYFLLSNAPISKMGEAPYPTAFKKALMAALASDINTKDLKVIFKDGAAADLDLLLDGNNLLVNDKWLDFRASHAKTKCWLASQDIEVQDFLCDHIIYDLIKLVLLDIGENPKRVHELTEDAKTAILLKVTEGLRQMPRRIALEKGNKPGQLMVFWTVLEENLLRNLYGLTMSCYVVLHRESTCSNKKADVSFSYDPESIDETCRQGEGMSRRGIADCGCPYAIHSQLDGGVVFDGLNMNEMYFPMISRFSQRAYFGIPPAAMYPPCAEIEESDSGEPHTSETPPSGAMEQHLNTRTANSTDEGDDFYPPLGIDQDFYDASANNQNSRIESPDLDHDSSHENQVPCSCGPDLEALRIELSGYQKDKDSIEHRLLLASRDVKISEEKLKSAQQELENEGLELRRVKAEMETLKQELNSTIEDLQGENQQLRENYAESERQSQELSSTLESLRAEHQHSAAGNVHPQPTVAESIGPASSIGSGSGGNVNSQHQIQSQSISQATKFPEAARLRISELEEKNEVLRKVADKAQGDKTSMITTLQGISGMIEGVLNLPTTALMMTPLRGVLSMIQGTLNLGSQQAAAGPTIKRERVKEESEDGTPLAKRFRQGEVISLD